MRDYIDLVKRLRYYAGESFLVSPPHLHGEAADAIEVLLRQLAGMIRERDLRPNIPDLVEDSPQEPL